MVAIVVNHTAKYSKAHNKHTALVEKTARKILGELCAEFDVPEGEILVRPIKGRGTRGRAWPLNGKGKFLVEIDCRLSNERMIAETLAHEFTHIEQHHQKRLVTKHNVREWTDQTGTHTYKQATTYAAYLRQPWEVEARARGKAFVDKHFPWRNFF
jgi:hypothetical protein